MPSTLVMTSTFSMITLLSLLNSADSEDLHFVLEPSVGTISLNRMLNITFQCLVDSNGPTWWTIHYLDTNQYLSTRDENDKIKLEEHGIHYSSGDTAANITIPGIVENNRTLIRCATFHGGVTEFSDQIRLIIAGHPSPPNPNLKVVSPSQLEIWWDIPYSHESDPIERYDIQIFNTSSGRNFDHSITQNRYVYTTEDGNVATKCQWFVFSVTAVSAQGQSMPGKVSGGFPIAPRSYSSDINVAVTFYGNHTPIAKVSFEAPFICDYQTSNLTITIADTTAITGLPALVNQSTYTGRSRMITETFDTGLLANHTYTLTITVSDSTFADDVSTAAVNFSTTIHSASPTSQDVSSGLQLRDIVIFAGGVFAILVAIMTIVIVSAIICLRKGKLRKAPGSTMDLMLNSINRSRASGRMNGSQYDTPYKSNPSLYETIDGYQKRTPTHKATTATTRHSWQHQEYLWKPQQHNFERKKSEGAESLYQEMHSATEHSLVNGYNNRHVMKPQNLEAPHNNSLKLHTYQDELHAPYSARSTSCKSTSLNDSNTGPGAPLPQSESFGDHLSTIAVVNESVGSNAEGDQSEYAYMSQEGTLAGQQGKLMLCTNGCVSDSSAENHVHNDENKTEISKNSAN